MENLSVFVLPNLEHHRVQSVTHPSDRNILFGNIRPGVASSNPIPRFGFARKRWLFAGRKKIAFDVTVIPLGAIAFGTVLGENCGLGYPTSGGVQPVRSVLRPLVLLQIANGVSASQIARFVPLTAEAIQKVGHRFEQGGLDRALFDKSRSGAASLLDAAQQQRIIAIVCSEHRLAGVAGQYARWLRKPSNGDWFPAWIGKQFE